MTAGESTTAPAASNSTSTRSQKPVSVLFVCLGNICRSPMAEGVFRHLTQTTKPPHPLISRIDSCGTGAYHVGDDPDPRTMSTLRKNGITTYTHAARKFQTSDFADFDYIFAMDDDNRAYLDRLRKRVVKGSGGDEEVGKVMLWGSSEFGGRDWKGRAGAEEVQDPYYGADDGFEVAYEQCVRFSRGFLKFLEAGEEEEL